MYQALYRKWRPKTFSDVYGQSHITDILQSEIANGQISHAYLFYGTRGTGKTTCAKILAKAVNCEHPVNGNPCGECAACKLIESGLSTDVIEIDAATNNGVDNVRNIRDDVAFLPTELKYRVLIIDEVHMMTVSAFNALLKTLEEPPKHMIFILATTEKHKIPATIISRCQRFDFHRIDTADIVARLRLVADSEKIDIDDDALSLIARMADGAMRDALGLLEVCKGQDTKTDAAKAAKLIGVSDDEILFSVANAVLTADYDKIYDICADVYKNGDIATFISDLVRLWRNMTVCCTLKNAEKYLDCDKKYFNITSDIAAKLGKSNLVYQLNILENLNTNVKNSKDNGKISLETSLIKMCDKRLDTDTASLIARINELEEKIFLLSNGAAIKADDAKPKTAPTVTKKEEKPSEKQTEKPIEENKNTATNDADTFIKLSSWADIVDRLIKKDASLAAFLDTYTAYISKNGKKVRLFSPDSFSINLIGDENIEMIATAIGVETQNPISPKNVEILHEKAKEKYELIDDIISQIDDAKGQKQ